MDNSICAYNNGNFWVETWVGSTGLWSGGYPVFDGTSASAPHIAGLAALYFHKLNGIDSLNKTNIDFKNDLTLSAATIESGTTGGIWNEKSGYGRADILAAINRSFQTVATPVITPPGGVYPAPPPALEITISCETPDAAIYYTEDGSVPKGPPQINGTLYQNTFTIDSYRIIKAKAFKTGYNESGLATEIYNFGTIQEVATVTPVSGIYPEPLTITISWQGDGYECYRTIRVDGTEPPDPANAGNNISIIWWNPHSEILRASLYKMKVQLKKDGKWGPVVYVQYDIRPTLRIAQIDDEITQGSNSFGEWYKWEDNNHWAAHPDETIIRPNNTSDWYVKASQEFKDPEHNVFRKYNVWSVNGTNNFFVNHAKIPVGSTTSSILAHFKQTYNVIVSNKLENSLSLSQGNFYFKNPWIVDDNSDPKGSRNRGAGTTEIPLLPYSINFSTTPNITTGSIHKGVFLNQTPDPNDPNKPYYSVKVDAVQDIYLSQTGKTHRFYFQNWSGTNVNFQNSNALETPVVFTSDGAIAQANYKGTQLSNSLNAYLNNSQRKVVKAYGDILYTTYESMGNIFLEKSTNNGVTWQFDFKAPNIYLNNYLAKSSSIDFVDTAFSPILVVFQEESSITDWSNIKLFERNSKYTPLAPYFVGETYTPNNADATPIVSVYGYNKFIVIWKGWDIDPVYGEKQGLFYRLGFRTLTNISWLTEKRWIPNTTVNSFNPSVAASKAGSGNPVFHLAWQENITSTLSKINYATLTFNSSNELNMGMVLNISNGSGFKKNYNPTIIELNGGAKVGWIGYRDGIYEADTTPNKVNSNEEIQVLPNPEWKVVFRDPAVSSFWQFGNNVNSPNINKANNNSDYFLLWTENNGQYNKFTDKSLSRIISLNTTGKDIQLSNGIDRNNMRASAFNSSSLPYYFSTSNSIGSYYQLQKTDGLAAISAGREGVVIKGDAEFYFAIGDIKVNDEVIEFIEIEDSVSINNLEKLNKYLVSKPFTINSNTTFNYGVQYGFTDSASVINSFANNEYINFKVELVDKNTNEEIGSFDDVRFDKGNVFQYDNISYNVNTEGINGNKEVYLRLRVDDNLEGEYSLSQKYADENVLLKSGSKEITYQGNLAVTSYDLAQNYPNPFNPSTTINYQIPKSGFVSLKVYDILGREVAILVNGEKEMGKYTVQFDGSKLASGVYIYEIRANEFVSVKKLMLLK